MLWGPVRGSVTVRQSDRPPESPHKPRSRVDRYPSMGDNRDMARPKLPKSIQIEERYARFVMEYIKDFAPRRAATATGFDPEKAGEIMMREDVQAAVASIVMHRLERADIDAEWHLLEAVDTYKIAKQTGKIATAVSALALIGKHTYVDAMASDKLNLNVQGDREVMERLNRGRARMNRERLTIDNDTGKELTFYAP